MKRQQLAKLTRPRLHKAVARERLFRLLDEKREHPVVWIVGPPGAGKTTLAASYLEEAGVPAIWYQIDPGDSDPATFFFYLKQAIEAVAKRKAKPLPLLTPEYLPDLPGFSRRFLRNGFARLPDEAILVFDNYHDIAADSALHVPFVVALAEVPQGSNIIVLSRADPPAGFAGALVNQSIALVSWEDLRLTAEETTSIAGSRGITEPKLLRALHDQSTGWIAGVTLMLERLRGGASLEALGQGEALDTVFDYFTGLIFDTASDEMREVLMKTAFLPRVSAALAEAVTGKPDAIEHIEELHRRHLFTDRSVAGEITFQFHALFRAFLKARALEAFSAEEWNAVAARTARALEADGQIENAFALQIETRDWDAAQRSLMDQAPVLIAQGRRQIVDDWVALLPTERVEANPWVLYWLGRSRTAVNPKAACESLQAAFDGFKSRDDATGELLSAAGVIEALFYQFDDFRAMDIWINRAAALLQSGVHVPSREDELMVHAALMIGATYRVPQHALLEKSVRRVEELLSAPLDVNLRVGVAAMVHSYYLVTMDFPAVRVAIREARPLLKSPQLTSARAAYYYVREAYTHYFHGRHREAFECVDRADGIALAEGLDEVAFFSGTLRGLCERRAGMLDRAQATLHRVKALRRPPSGFRFSIFLLLKASVAFERGETDVAVTMALSALRSSEESGAFGSIMVQRIVAANMAIAAGELDLAGELLTRAGLEAAGQTPENYRGAITLNEAWLAQRRGKEARRDELLCQALKCARDVRARERFRWHGNAMSELLPLALARGIEADMARALAREFAVAPRPENIEDWPWPMKVYTLGHFELLIDGTAPGYSRKAPKKVLALLKVIIAFGARDVSEQKLLDALWPDQDGDAASHSLTTTLHRLRKLLGNVAAIRQAGGELTLDRQYCWVDSIAFEERFDRAAGNDEQVQQAVTLYRGAFLIQEDYAPWAVPARERLRAKFIQAISKLGNSLEAATRHEAAIDLYLRGIEADPLVEPFYQGLMRCYEKLNRCTEAMSAYRRLRETLSVTLGVPPSSATQRLFEALRLN